MNYSHLILAHLADRGFSVVLDGGRLLVTPGSALTDEERKEITDNKADLVAELSRPDWGPAPRPQERPWPHGSAGIMLGIKPWQWCGCGRRWTIGGAFDFCTLCGEGK